jgi:hypothetical protein
MAKRRTARRRTATKAGRKKAVKKKATKKKAAKKKAAKKPRSAKPKRPAVARNLSAPSKPWVVGPQLSPTEKAVHIIHIPVHSIACGSTKHPTKNELAQLVAVVVAQAGRPAPTDVIVYDGEPYQMPNGNPGLALPHPQVHEFRETVLVVRGRNGESPTWWSDEPFTITDVRREDLPNFPHASTPPTDPPFPVPIPAMRTGDIYVARGPVPDPGSWNHQWKISFEMAGQTIDPHMDI